MLPSEFRDLDGRPVTLNRVRWTHIVDRVSGHPEIAGLREEVIRAVQAPDRRKLGHESNEEWFYRGNVGPSRWIKVVVIYEAGRGTIITAFPRRSFP